MASKMLRNRVTDVIYCVRCANETEVMEAEKKQLRHTTHVGNAVCSVCGKEIATLPEPTAYTYDVDLRAVISVQIEASSPIEAMQLSESGIAVEGNGITHLGTTIEEATIIDND